jgi:hypothetical protein
MIGYGEEDTNFVVELTYNYGVRSYERGDDFNYLKIRSSQVIQNLKDKNYPFKLHDNGLYEIHDPNGYRFLVEDNQNKSEYSVSECSLFITDAKKSCEYWVSYLGLKGGVVEHKRVEVSFSEFKFKLVLVESGTDKINHAKAYGRIAFSCPTSELKPLQDQMEGLKQTILTKLISLDTPGKATVRKLFFF